MLARGLGADDRRGEDDLVGVLLDGRQRARAAFGGGRDNGACLGRLADRLNQMVVGLRERVNLAKFVSKGAISAVASASGAMRRHGMRRHVVVLFSDIRGFTSFSETREPEEVLSMLNAYLQAQAEVVHAHGGDIDKFVGDELMALFYGEAAETDAAKCGVAMIEAVRKENLSRGVDGVAIGIGINAGPAIVGAMGAEARMDFTAIGDTVNLSARLCSNAAPGQVLVTRAIVAKVQEGAGAADLVFCPLEPILVKGKAQPIPIFAVSDTARRGKDS